MLVLLTDKTIQNSKPKEKRWEQKDADGLILDIMPSGSRIWRYQYSKDYKDRKMTIGEYPLISLKAAREIRDEARLKLRRGEDPIQDKSAMTLNEVYQDYKKNKMIGILSGDYIEQVNGCHRNHIAPSHGNTLMKNINTQDILSVLRGMEADGKLAQASRVKQIYGQLFYHAIIFEFTKPLFQK